MITLGTGLPGTGKTLFMLWLIAAKAKKENREVYYHNIKGLNGQAVGNWQEFEPLKWFDLPSGSIIVIDECQDIFGKKPNGSALPEHYSQLNTHRHKGFDIYLISQHPTLLDNSVRRLVGQHYHSVRKFGLQRSTVYEWSACNPAPENPSSQKSAVTLKWSFPKEVFTWYKSAEVHTVKRAIPMKLVLAALFVVALPLCGYFALDAYQHRYDKPVANNKKTPAQVELDKVMTDVQNTKPAMGTGASMSPAVDPVADAKQYLWKETPRIVGLPQTAPKYDQLTVPQRVPIPAMCIQKGNPARQEHVDCKCFSQQGTPMGDVPFNMCIEFARNGFFQDFDADKDRQASERSAASVQVLNNRADASLPVRDAQDGPRVGVLSGLPMGPQRTDKSAPMDMTIQDGPPNNRATRAVAGATVAGL